MRAIALLMLLLVVGVGVASAQQPPTTPKPPEGQPPDINALASHQIYLATSQDGLMWQMDNVLIRPATSVPALVYWQDSLWILAVNGTPDEDFERLVMLHQLPDATWEEWFIDLNFEGRPVDPELMVLPDGRLRLYFFDFPGMAPNSGPPPPDSTVGRIYSATSEDGRIFTLEEGYRLAPQPPATDPDVIQQSESQWWMFVSHPEQGDMVIASSTDGLTFEEVGAVTHGSISDTVLLEDGRLRQYACVRGPMVVMESSDGLTWQAVPNTHMPPGCDPDAVQLPDGSWVMVYKTLARP